MTDFSLRYDIGRPKLRDIWIDPNSGDDSNSGSSRGEALRTVAAAWTKIPAQPAQTGVGYRVLFTPGEHHGIPNTVVRLKDRHGTFDCPIIFQPSDGPHTAVLPSIYFTNCDHVHLLDVKFVSPGMEKLSNSSENNVFRMMLCNHCLIRNVAAIGLGRTLKELPVLTFKGSQCRYLYVEDCDFSGAKGNALDYVACQNGHIVRSKFHRTHGECFYIKGGSAHFIVAFNEAYDGQSLGFNAGQGTGLQYMVPPWLHYEAYDIKFFNNYIHDILGSAFAVNGGYNVLMAHNTCVRLGSERLMVVGMGGHGPGAGVWEPKCDEYMSMGAWCNTPGEEFHNIPCRNVYIYNNLLFNPEPQHSKFGHFGISGDVKTEPGSNMPPVVTVNDNLRIRGNVIWNGPRDLAMFDPSIIFHMAAKPSYDGGILKRDNTINAIRPEFVDEKSSDFHPLPGGNLTKIAPAPIPDFTGGDAPTRPQVPQGDLSNDLSGYLGGKRYEAVGKM